MSTLSRTALLLILACLDGSAIAQTIGGREELVFRFDGSRRASYLGVVEAAGDVNADGVEDFLLGAPRGGIPISNRGGAAYVYSGANGALLHSFSGSGAQDFFGGSLAGIGDLDGDGYDDVAVGAPDVHHAPFIFVGSVFVYSGFDGSQLLRLDGTWDAEEFGMSIAAAGDIDHDGTPDLIIGGIRGVDAFLIPTGSAYVYSGASGTLLHKFDGEEYLDLWGYEVESAGDVDADGTPDLIVGSPFVGYSSPDSGGRVAVYSGRTGQLLYDYRGERHSGRFGNNIGPAGDVNGDDHDDFFMNVPTSGASTACQGAISILSGKTGGELLTLRGETGDCLGDSASGGRDWNGDGVLDLAIGGICRCLGYLPKAGTVQIFSSDDGRRLFRVDGTKEYTEFGGSVALAGDSDGDGFGNLLVGAMTASPAGVDDAGSVFVFDWDPYLALDSRFLSLSSGTPATVELDFPPTEAGLDYLLLASLKGDGPSQLGPLTVPLDRDVLFERLLAGWIPPNAPASRGSLDALGDASVSIWPAPPLAPHVGRQVWLAAVTSDPLLGTVRLGSVARTLTLVL